MNRKFVRCLCPFLSLILVFTYMAEPVSAAENFYFNVLDYSCPNNGDSTLLWYTDSVTFSVPYSQILQVDLFVKSNVSDLTAKVIQGSTALNLNVSFVYSVGSTYYYRLYGETPGYTGSSLGFEFNWSSGNFIDFISVRASSFQTNSFAENGSATLLIPLSSHGVSETFTILETDPYVHYAWQGGTGFDDFRLSFFCPDWRKYDYVDVHFRVRCSTINTITALSGSTELPLSSSIINSDVAAGADGVSGQDQLNTYDVFLTMDLTGISRDTVIEPAFDIHGNTGRNGGIEIYLYSFSGHVSTDDMNPLFYYFRSLEDNLASFFETQNQFLEDIESTERLIYAYQIQYASEITSLISNLWNNSMKPFFESWISSIQLKFDEVKQSIRDVKDEISNRYLDLSGKLTYEFNRLIEVIHGDSSKTEELDQSSSQIQNDVQDIHQFEQDQQAVLDNNFTVIQSAVTVTNFAAALAFVQGYTNSIFSGLGNVVIIFTMPLFIGLFFYVCSRIPGATRWRPSSGAGRSATGTKASGKGGKEK